MYSYMTFSILIIIAFFIIAFPIILDVIKMKKSQESVELNGLVRRSVTLCLVFAYVSMVIFNFVFSKQNAISEDFKALLLTVIGYYFGKSTALDNPNKNNTITTTANGGQSQGSENVQSTKEHHG